MKTPRSARALPPVAHRVDRALCELDDRVDWLWALSPRNADALWQRFADSGFTASLELDYPPDDPELPELRRRLLALPVEEVEEPALEALLWEKQREIDRQIELVQLRGTPGLLVASLDLWGDVDAGLLRLAEEILDALGPHREPLEEADCETVRQEAVRLMDLYRERDARFPSDIVIDDHLSSKLMVSQGRLHIARGIRIPLAQVHALIQHEVGTHVLTRHNGAWQPLRQLEVGLAHYDALQEGLGVLAEYLSGYLSTERLRILAARVVAAAAICRGIGMLDTFHRLTEQYRLEAHDAFDVGLRAVRGGGLTKDAVYLRGLRDLLDYLHQGGGLDVLFIGKLALSQLPILEELANAGYVVPPAVLPTYLDTATGRERLEACRDKSLLELATEDVRP